MNVKISIITQFGEYISSLIVSEEEYYNLIEISKGYYNTGFDMKLDSGGHVIIPPEIIAKSVMVISII